MSDIKDVVQDVVKMAASLGVLDHVRIDGSAESTEFTSTSDNVMFRGQSHQPLAGFEGTFGFGNLNFLSGISGIRSYKEEGASVELLKETRNGVESPSALLFKDEFSNTDRYRLMNESQINGRDKFEMAMEPPWEVTFEPTKQKVAELQEIAGIYGGIEPNFAFSSEDGNLVVTVGDSGGSFTGKRVFSQNVSGEIASGFSYPLSEFLSILKLGMSGQCTVSLSSMGMLKVTVDTGVGSYEYYLPAYT